MTYPEGGAASGLEVSLRRAAGAEVNTCDRDGRTALSFAVEQGEEETVALLRAARGRE